MNVSDKDVLVKHVRNFAKKHSLSDDIHGFEHVMRVYNLCISIGKKCNANLFVLKTASLLHDIGRIKEQKQQTNINHAELSAQKASKFLKEWGEELNQPTIKDIIHAIRAHSFSNNIKPDTLEAKILSDADKLDALGAIGLYRTIGFTIKHKGNIRDVINHLEEKLLNLKNQMNLPITQQLAEERHQILAEFHQKIIKEL